MVLFFYGQDSYRSWKKLQELKARYIDASLGDTNLQSLDAASVTVDQLANGLLAYPFLAKTRLVVLDRLLSRGSKSIQEKFLEMIEKIPDTTVAVVYEAGVPDRRTVLFKTLAKLPKTTEFKPLVGRSLEAWMAEELKPYEASIDPEAATRLAERTDGDTWRLAMELQKLGTTLLDSPSAERVVTIDLVESLIRDTKSTEIFAISDALASGSAALALKTLRALLGQGESPQYLLALVANTIRTLVLIRDSLDAHITNANSIAATTKLKPFVVGKHLQAAKRFSASTLADRFDELARIDLDSKRGKIDAEVGLELFVIKATAV